jgi:hypothetical protein
VQKGSVILHVLLVSAVFAVLAPVAGTLAMSEVRIARSHALQTTALYIAEAGVELAIARLRAEPGFTTPANTPITGALSGGSFSVNVTAGMGSERIITAIGSWGGGQQRASARVTFNQAQAPLQTFLFQHTVLSGGHTRIRNSTVRGPVRVLGLQEEGTNRFDPGQPMSGSFGPSQAIPPVNFNHYQTLANANPSLWHVTTSRDLDQTINTARSLGRQRILIAAGDDRVTLDEPVNFTGLIVIQAEEVRLRSDINAGRSDPLVILTAREEEEEEGGDIDIRPGDRVDTLGNNTLLYSSGTVALTRSEGGGTRQMTGIVVARQGGAEPRDLWNANLTYNNAMLHLLQQDAQPDFRQTQAAGTGMDVTFISPQQ